MKELYEKYKNELNDLKISNSIQTFSNTDLLDFLGNSKELDRKLIRKFIKKNITRNMVINQIYELFMSSMDSEQNIDHIKELDYKLRGKELHNLVEEKEELLNFFSRLPYVAEALSNGSINKYFSTYSFSYDKSLKIEIDSTNTLYSKGISLSMLTEYAEAFCEYGSVLLFYYDSDMKSPYIEENELEVMRVKNLIEEYDVMGDLEEIEKNSINIKSYLKNKYYISESQSKMFNQLIDLHKSVEEEIENVNGIIDNILFTIDHSKLLKEYANENLKSEKRKLLKLKKAYSLREMSTLKLKKDLRDIAVNVKRISDNFIAINEIEMEYLPQISARSSMILDDVKSYYNFSIRKNIERRKGEYGFSKQITSAEIDVMVAIIQEKLYVLTDDQLNAIYRGAEYLNYGYTTNCLLQGDVSSGKTIVSVALMFILAQKGYKSAYIVPRKTLRIQHLNTLKKYNEIFDLNLKIENVDNVTDLSKVDIVLSGYSFNKPIFKNVVIDMAFVDEIQLLGVKQRNQIQELYENIDMFYTTATPHPRTKTISLIGNMDIIEIRELPPGRRPKITRDFRYSSDFILNNDQLIRETIGKGEMMIVVCPLVNADNGDIGNVHTAYELFKNKYPEYNVTKMLAGDETKPSKQMGLSLMDEKLSDCSNGKVNILVTTKIVEVGVDIPCASIMVIAHPIEGFGYGVSTLHQLRGRVGRRSQQAYCFIQAPKGYKTGSATHTILETEDVFKITEKDLDWRGIDKIIGINQTNKGGNKKNTSLLISEYKYIADKVKTAIANLDDEMFEILCNEIDTSKKIKDLN